MIGFLDIGRAAEGNAEAIGRLKAFVEKCEKVRQSLDQFDDGAPVTIEMVYRRRVAERRATGKSPMLFLVSEDQRQGLIREAMLMERDLAASATNLQEMARTGEFKLFGVRISTIDRERIAA